MTLTLLIIGTLVNAGYSWKDLRRPDTHGFFRFFVFEAILLLVLLNAPVWFTDPFSPQQVISWILLMLSIVLAVQGFVLLHIVGRPEGDFEHTTRLVETGAYRYIRHPLYASLLALGWGAFLKEISPESAVLVGLLTLFAILTARTEERENLTRFGSTYADYMKRTRRFIPFLY